MSEGANSLEKELIQTRLPTNVQIEHLKSMNRTADESTLFRPIFGFTTRKYNVNVRKEIRLPTHTEVDQSKEPIWN